MTRFYQIGLFTTSIFISAFALADTATAAEGGASIAACGNIHIDAEAECELEVEGGCLARCEPVSFTAACAAELRANCSGKCNVEVDAQCTSSCQGSCEAACEVDPGGFDCAASCRGNCGANCAGFCEGEAEGSEARLECEASCKAECDAECDVECGAVPPQANCTASCQASCQGECRAEANMNCHIDCQAQGYVDCKADLQGGCEIACEQPEGALFCDGQYIDHGGNLEECADAIIAFFNIMIEGYANASCGNGACQAEAGFSCSCSSTKNSEHARNALLASIFGLGLAIGTRRRRIRQ